MPHGHQENEPSRENALHDHRTRTASSLARRANRSALPRDGVGRLGAELAGDEVCLLGMAAAVSAGLGRRYRCGGACAFAVATGVSLKVPADQWPRLIISAILNVALWVAVMSYALLWLPASEAVVIAYTMPVWTALLAWPLLGERLALLRVIALVMAFAGLVSLFGTGGISANMAKLPGVLLALTGSVGFAVGTIFLKRYPVQMPGATSATWQIAIGSVPIALAGTLLEHPHIAALSSAGWFALGYMTLAGPLHRLCHLVWRGRAPAGLGRGDRHTMLVPVIGVVVSAIALHEPLGLSQIAALVFTVAGVALAARS